jgi:hypothetical protein
MFEYVNIFKFSKFLKMVQNSVDALDNANNIFLKTFSIKIFFFWGARKYKELQIYIWGIWIQIFIKMTTNTKQTSNLPFWYQTQTFQG